MSRHCFARLGLCARRLLWGPSGRDARAAIVGKLAAAELFRVGCGDRTVSSRFIAGGHSFIFFVFKGAECWQRDAAMSWDGVTCVLPGGSTVFCDSGCLCDCCRMDQNQALFILMGSGLFCALASWGAVVTDCSA